MPVNLGKTGNKPPVRVDVSPKPRADFSVRDRTIAIMIVVAFIAIISLGIGAFYVHNNRAVEEALAEVAAQKEGQEAEYAQKLLDLATRERAVATKETKLATREDALAKAEADLESAQALLISDRADLTAEEEAFYDKQSRVRELSEALYLELTPTDE